MKTIILSAVVCTLLGLRVNATEPDLIHHKEDMSSISFNAIRFSDIGIIRISTDVLADEEGGIFLAELIEEFKGFDQIVDATRIPFCIQDFPRWLEKGDKLLVFAHDYDDVHINQGKTHCGKASDFFGNFFYIPTSIQTYFLIDDADHIESQTMYIGGKSVFTPLPDIQRYEFIQGYVQFLGGIQATVKALEVIEVLRCMNDKASSHIEKDACEELVSKFSSG